MKKNSLRFSSMFLVLIMIVSSLAGCGNNQSEANKESASSSPQAQAEKPSESPAGKKEDTKKESTAKDTLIVVTENEPSKVSTHDHNILASDYINEMTHNGLFRRNMELEPVPDMVDTYEAVTDIEWIMKLKEGIKFHDGSVVTAEDVKATLDFTKTFPECKLYTSSIVSVEVIDDLTVKIITDGPKAQLLSDLAHHANYILPKQLIDSGNDFNKNPIGTGPYKFVKWTYGEVIELEAFDDYFDTEKKASIPKIEWKVVPEASSRTIALESGLADLIIEVGSSDIKRLQENPEVEVIVKPGTGYFFLMLNNEKPPFDNVLVRKALNAGIDKDAIVAVALEGLADPAVSQTPPIFKGTSLEHTDTYDPEKARAYFEESGVDPKTIELEIIVTGDETRRAAEVIQSNLIEFGVTINITNMDNATALQNEFAGNYVGAIGSYTTFSLLSYLGGVFHSRQYNASNRTRTVVPEIDNFIDTASITIDPVERESLLNQCSSFVNNLTPLVPLYQNTVKRAYNANLKNFDVTPVGMMRLNEVSWE
ncbi:MAG: ABC transporter substrate-binding protein [Lachnospiraceae bacterium]|nr:ABC transporter substrate-binding protein [Lachnospiraceae bacterium]